jgi:hypothetical protein
MPLAQLKLLAEQAFRLHDRLYNASMTAAIRGDRTTSDRLNLVAQKAFMRYERRYHAYCRAKT